jgi:hypothetical protein
MHNSAEDVLNGHDGSPKEMTGTRNRLGENNKAYYFKGVPARVNIPAVTVNGAT